MASYEQLVQEYVPTSAVKTFRCLIYGGSGSGKTTLAGSFPKPFFIDTDRGMRSLTVTGAKFLRLPETGAFSTMLSILTDVRNARGPFAQGGKFADRQTIVIDSISALADEYLITEIMRENKRDPTAENAQRDDYGRLKIELTQLGNLIKDISDTHNVVVTALVEEEKDDLTGAIEGKPLMTGRYRDIIGAVFDEEYFVEVQEMMGKHEYRLYAAKYKYYEAKSRLLKTMKHTNATYESLRKDFKSA